jgi:L-fuconolactonase
MSSSNALEMIVDAHVHIIDTRKFVYPWIERVPAINRAYSPEVYKDVSKDCGISKYICIEAAVAPHQSEQEIAWLEQLSLRDDHLVGIVGYANVAQGSAVENELERLARTTKLKGIRFTLGKAYQKNPRLCLNSEFIEGVQCLEKHDLSFDLAFDPDQSDDIYEFAKSCPNVQLIVNHTGKPKIADQIMQPWLGFMEKLASMPHVSCKISDILRLLYGSDFPVVTMYGSYAAQFHILSDIFKELSDDEQQDFFCRTAQRLYRI